MGGIFSGLTKEDISGIREHGCRFTDQEIKKIYIRFKELDKEEMGYIEIERLLCIPEISINPLGERVIRKICGDANTLDFKRFLEILTIFSTRSTNKEKSKFFADILSSDGPITRKDLEEIANDIYGGIYKKEQIEEAIEVMFEMHGKKGKEIIKEEEVGKIDCSCLNIIL